MVILISTHVNKDSVSSWISVARGCYFVYYCSLLEADRT